MFKLKEPIVPFTDENGYVDAIGKVAIIMFIAMVLAATLMALNMEGLL